MIHTFAQVLTLRLETELEPEQFCKHETKLQCRKKNLRQWNILSIKTMTYLVVPTILLESENLGKILLRPYPNLAASRKIGLKDYTSTFVKSWRSRRKEVESSRCVINWRHFLARLVSSISGTFLQQWQVSSTPPHGFPVHNSISLTLRLQSRKWDTTFTSGVIFGSNV